MSSESVFRRIFYWLIQNPASILFWCTLWLVTAGIMCTRAPELCCCDCYLYSFSPSAPARSLQWITLGQVLVATLRAHMLWACVTNLYSVTYWVQLRGRPHAPPACLAPDSGQESSAGQRTESRRVAPTVSICAFLQRTSLPSLIALLGPAMQLHGARCRSCQSAPASGPFPVLSPTGLLGR